MKQLIILLTILFSLKCYSQNNPDAIVGKWLKIPKENLIIEVYKTGNEYKGKVTWAKDNDKTKTVGFIILEKLKYNSRNKRWEKGKIHSPNSGNTYNATVKMKADHTLEVNGYKGVKFIGKKKYFKKVK
jgi:uncharacterized protein (DUF2147 family)